MVAGSLFSVYSTIVVPKVPVTLILSSLVYTEPAADGVSPLTTKSVAPVTGVSGVAVAGASVGSVGSTVGLEGSACLTIFKEPPVIPSATFTEYVTSGF